MKIDLHRLIKASLKLDFKNSSYIQSYPEFIKYFKDCKKINNHNLIIGAHFVYGWMPTILNLKSRDLNRVVSILNKAKTELITVGELEILKSSINNSLVGVSKLLHFINPKKYAILDSNVAKIAGISSSQVQNPGSYLGYIAYLTTLSKDKDCKSLNNNVNKACGYKVTPLRAIELVMFELGRIK